MPVLSSIVRYLSNSLEDIFTHNTYGCLTFAALFFNIPSRITTRAHVVQDRHVDITLNLP